MNTNDTWRGLLVEARELLGDIWGASYEHDAGDALRALDIGERIDAALAEPASGGEFGDPYQGARQDLAIWKKRALEAEKALREERILTERLCNALNEENGPMFMGEPKLAALNGGAVAGQSKPEPAQAGAAVVRLELVDYNGTGLHIRQWDALQTLQPGTYELAIAAPFTPEAHAESGWIACADRMPEEAGSYITFSPHGYWPQQVHVWLVNEQAWEHEWLSKPRKELRPKTWVTHWQPLRPSPSAKAVRS